MTDFSVDDVLNYAIVLFIAGIILGFIIGTPTEKDETDDGR